MPICIIKVVPVVVFVYCSPNWLLVERAKTIPFYIPSFLSFKKGFAVGLKGDLIHIFNKNQSAVQNTDYFERQGGRQNIMLLGDSMGDLTMAAGAKGDRNIIKIGFLNDKVRLIKYSIFIRSIF